MCWLSWIVLLSNWKVDISRIQNANKCMQHRWPDSAATWISDNESIWFGHVRLSIVDVDARSNQPFSIDDWRYVIAFNGEIYNYLDLKNNLLQRHNIQFVTTSDTEVLLYMYKFYGKECLQYIEGMFAFSIYDKEANQVLVARDFMGQKPLIYAVDDEWLYFASDIPSLLRLQPNLSKEIDYSVLHLYLLDNISHIPGNVCIFKNIHKLPNASYMILEDGCIIEHGRYSKLQYLPTTHKDTEVEFLYNKLEQMKPKDIDYAAFLSGGIDSSFVCSGLQKNSTNATDAYTLKVGENDADFERSKDVSRMLHLDQHIITMDEVDILESINQSIGLLWEPYFHITSAFADAILHKAKEKHKVVFTWAGGDECYYGYDNILFLLMDAYFAVKKLLPYTFIKRIDKVTNWKYTTVFHSTIHTFKENHFVNNFKKVAHVFIDKSIHQEVEKTIHDMIEDFKSFVEYKRYIDFSYMFWLFIENAHSLVIQWDLIGMKNSIEVRSLFLEKEVIERAYALPLYKKINFLRPREWKEILRKQLVSIFGRSFVYAKKIWFGVKYDVKNKFELDYKDSMYEKIAHLLTRNIFEKTIVEEYMLDFQKNFRILMKLYSLEIRFEKHIDARE